VPADETWQDNATSAIDDAVRLRSARIPDGGDSGVFDENVRMLKDTALFVHGRNRCIPNERAHC
jgi:hypothetical protein